MFSSHVCKGCTGRSKSSKILECILGHLQGSQGIHMSEHNSGLGEGTGV